MERRTSRLVAIFLAMFLAAPVARSIAAPTQTEPVPGECSPWHFTQLASDAGLTGAYVMHVAFDDEGVVWLATTHGLVHYDGFEWTRFSTDDGLPSDFVRCVTVLRDGRLVIGTDDGLAVRDRRGVFSSFEAAEPFRNIRRVVEVADGSLWLCADTWRHNGVPAGLARYRDGVWEVFDGPLPGNYVSDAFETRDGRVLVLTRKGLVEYDSSTGEWKRALPDDDESISEGQASYVWSVVETDRDIIAATATTLYFWRNGRWHGVPYEGLNEGLAKSLFVLDNQLHTVLPGPRKSVARWNGSRFVAVGTPFVGGSFTEYTGLAPDGAIWIVGYSNVTRWNRDAEWTAYDVPPPAGLDADGGLWFLGEEACMRLSSQGWESMSLGGGDLSFSTGGAVWWSHGSTIRMIDPTGGDDGFELDVGRNLTAVIPRSDDSVWVIGSPDDRETRVGLVRNGICEWLPASWLPSGSIRSWTLEKAGDGLLINLAIDEHRGGVYHLTPEGVTSLGDPVGRPALGLRIGSRRDGTIWAWGPFGLWQFESGGWTRVPGLPGMRVSAFEQRGDETWVVCDGTWGGRSGVAVYRDGFWTVPTSDVTAFLGRSVDGALYFADSEGRIACQQPGERTVNRFAIPVDGPVWSVWGDATGRIWVATSSGILRYQSHHVPPRTIVSAFPSQVIEGEAWRGRVEGVDRYRSRDASNVEVSWRLGDDAWSPFTRLSGNELAVNADRGEHTLTIRSRSQGFNVETDPPVVTFRILAPPIQARSWFLPAVLTILGVIALLTALLAYSRLQLGRHASILESIVAERTREVRATTALLQATFDHLPVDVWVSDVGGRLIRQNRKSIRHIGDQQGYLLADVRDENPSVSRWIDDHRRAVGGEIVSGEHEQLIDGKPSGFYSVVAPVWDDDAIIALVGIDVDISEQKETEASLRRNRERFRLLAEASPSVIFQSDAEGKPTYVNERWSILTGRSREEERPIGWWECVHPDDRDEVRTSWDEAVRTRRQWQREFRVVHTDGGVRWVFSQAVATSAQGAGGLIGVCIDITERHEQEQQRRRMANELDHRVKNNLASVLSLVRLTRDSADSIEQFVTTLSGRIMAMARTHESLASRNWQGMPIGELVRSALDSMTPNADRVSLRGPDVALDAAAAGPLSFCLHELSMNASRHGALSQAVGHVDVSWDIDPDDGSLDIRWAETTPGLDASVGLNDGVGLGLIRGFVVHELSGSLDINLEPTGLCCTIRLGADRLRPALTRTPVSHTA